MLTIRFHFPFRSPLIAAARFIYRISGGKAVLDRGLKGGLCGDLDREICTEIYIEMVGRRSDGRKLKGKGREE